LWRCTPAGLHAATATSGHYHNGTTHDAIWQLLMPCPSGTRALRRGIWSPRPLGRHPYTAPWHLGPAASSILTRVNPAIYFGVYRRWAPYIPRGSASLPFATLPFDLSHSDVPQSVISVFCIFCRIAVFSRTIYNTPTSAVITRISGPSGAHHIAPVLVHPSWSLQRASRAGARNE
jgi:hypothetical protein